MILSNLRLTVSQDRKAEFIETLRVLRGPTSVEPGCLSCRFYQDVNDENSFALVEEWESEEALKSHLRNPEYNMLLSMMNLLAVYPPEVKFHTVSDTSGMEEIGSALGIGGSALRV